ncbi:extracellular solute-binding protein [Paenibacillus sp. CC-CFT747]|nr:extracellular solute-binding protein [Paenibacillus sp. CC-CFT747]
MLRKTVSFILVLLPVFSTGCTVLGPSSPQASPNEKSREIKIVANSLGVAFPKGTDVNHNPYVDYIEKETGIRLNVTLPPLNGYDEKLNLIMGSGTGLDMINTSNSSWFVHHVNRHALLPLTGLIEKYGPNLKKKIPQEAWDMVTVNGEIYAIPSLNEVKGNEIMYARKDWLDRLGLKPPHTLEEYTAVMKAFAGQDPDGDGRKDTYGFSMLESMGRTSPLLGAFGVQWNAWYERDGKLVYSGILPEMKQALAYFRDLYEQDVLDPEFPINKMEVLGDKITNGQVGLYSAAWSDTRMYIAANRAKDPKAEWIPLDFPVGSGGRSGVYNTPVVRSYNMIPVGSEHAEEVIRFLDFVAGPGQTTLKLGFQGDVWTRENDRLAIRFDRHVEQGYRGIYGALADMADPVMTKERLEALGPSLRLSENVQSIESHLMINRFTGPSVPAMGKHQVKLSGLQEETFTRIVAGISPSTTSIRSCRSGRKWAAMKLPER